MNRQLPTNPACIRWIASLCKPQNIYIAQCACKICFVFISLLLFLIFVNHQRLLMEVEVVVISRWRWMMMQLSNNRFFFSQLLADTSPKRKRQQLLRRRSLEESPRTQSFSQMWNITRISRKRRGNIRRYVHANYNYCENSWTIFQVADDPETLRIKQNTKNFSNVAYHGDIQKKAAMERQREMNEIVDNRGKKRIESVRWGYSG